MGKPKLYIKFIEETSDHLAMADSPETAEMFEVTRGTGPPPRDVDIVYAQAYTNKKVLGQLRRWGGPYVLQAGGDIWAELYDFPSRMDATVDAMNHAAAVICVSRHLAGMYSERIVGGNFVALPGGLWGTAHSKKGVNPGRFEVKCDWSLSDPPRVVCAMSMTSRNKWRGLPVFLACMDAVAKHRKVEVICTGKAKRCEHITTGWQKKFRFFKFTWAGTKYPEFLNRADVFVHPSLFDGWPRALAEAMCSGLPCVAFRAAGVPEVSDKVILCDPKKPHEMSNVVCKLLDDEGLRKGLGMASAYDAKERTDAHRYDHARLIMDAYKKGQVSR